MRISLSSQDHNRRILQHAVLAESLLQLVLHAPLPIFQHHIHHLLHQIEQISWEQKVFTMTVSMSLEVPIFPLLQRVPRYHLRIAHEDDAIQSTLSKPL